LLLSALSFDGVNIQGGNASGAFVCLALLDVSLQGGQSCALHRLVGLKEAQYLSNDLTGRATASMYSQRFGSLSRPISWSGLAMRTGLNSWS
jgi:hypothetical protein